jgi:hypothetical protein
LTNDKREQLIRFCVKATALLHGVDKSEIGQTEFIVMSDEALEREANRLVNWMNY